MASELVVAMQGNESAHRLDTLREPVQTARGMVCSGSPHAGEIGARVLRDGGNAFDAAIAVAAAEGVTLPSMSGPGGEVFALLYQASTRKLYCVTGCGRAPLGATREYFLERGYTKMPVDGPLAPSVPGEVHAWQTIVDRFGTMSLASLVTPAADLAESGFEVFHRNASYWQNHLAKLNKYESGKRSLTKNGAPYLEGDTLVRRDLGRTLRRIAEGGAREFYQGALANEIAASIQAAGGLIGEEDLARQETLLYEDPPSVEYRGYSVHATALPSHGPLLLEMLGLLDGFDLASMGYGSARTIHTLVEAKRLAYADRLAYIGDPEFMDVPLQTLLSKAYAEERRRAVDLDRAAAAVSPGQVRAAVAPNSDTAYSCIVDAEGNAVSFIHSLSNPFGSGFVAGDTGILLNNRAGRGFYLDEGHPNVVAPGKRTINTIHAYMVSKDGSLRLVGGTPGGDGQPQWNVQVLTSLLDFGRDVQEAADAPRWVHFPGTDQATIDRPIELRMEEGFSDAVLADLRRRGHNVTDYRPEDTIGAVQLIAIDPATGRRTGGSDRRCDGYPVVE